MQKKFWSEMGLRVSMVKKGSGSTNDGNTARRFFENPEKSAEILGFNHELHKRYSVILKALNSGFHINTENFRAYCMDTAKLILRSISGILFHPPFTDFCFTGLIS